MTALKWSRVTHEEAILITEGTQTVIYTSSDSQPGSNTYLDEAKLKDFFGSADLAVWINSYQQGGSLSMFNKSTRAAGRGFGVWGSWQPAAGLVYSRAS